MGGKPLLQMQTLPRLPGQLQTPPLLPKGGNQGTEPPHQAEAGAGFHVPYAACLLSPPLL